MRYETLDATVLDYIKEIEKSYEQQIKELQKEYEARIKEAEWKYLEIKERYDILIYKQFVRNAEQLMADEKQLLLFTEETGKTETVSQTEQEKQQEVKSYKRSKGGRKPLDPRLPRKRRIIDIPEDEKICACGAKLTKIGEEVSEKLHIEPPRIYVEKIIRPKYACTECEGIETEGTEKTVRIAPVEPSIIPKSIVSPSLLSTIVVQKFEDHLPYYRQEKQFERIGVSISRQDMSCLAATSIQKAVPLI
jgi:transposase